MKDWLPTLLAALGGTFVAILALGGWLTNTVTTGLLNRLEHRWALERERSLRFESHQFALYQSLWEALYDLQTSADRLWARASPANLGAFVQQLEKTEREVGRSSLLLERPAKEQLDNLFELFWQFEVGKKSLIELYRKGADVGQEEIRRAVTDNRALRERYTELLPRLEEDFRRHVRLDIGAREGQ